MSVTDPAPSIGDSSVQLRKVLEQLDVTVFAGEDGSLQLLSFLADLDKILEQAAEPLDASAYEALATALDRIWDPSSDRSGIPCVFLGKPARRLFARFYGAVFTAREGKGLFERMQIWLGCSTDSQKSISVRIDALELLALMLLSHGDKVASMHTEILSASSKLFRSTSQPNKLRCSSLRCVSAISASASLSQNTVRDWLRILRAHLSDKSASLQRAAAQTILTLCDADSALQTLADVDGLLLAILKGFEQSSWQGRRILVKVAVRILLVTQVERPIIVPSLGQTTNKGTGKEEAEQQAEDDLPNKLSASTTSKTMLTPTEMLERLTRWYNRLGDQEGTRNAVIDCLALLLKTLGASYVELHFESIRKHILLSISSGSYAMQGDHEQRVSVRHSKILLGNIVCGELLKEDGRATVYGYLLDDLSAFASSTAHDLASVHTVVAAQNALDTMASILNNSGCSSLYTQTRAEAILRTLLVHSHEDVRTCAAITLGAYLRNDPSRLQSVLPELLDALVLCTTQLAKDDTAVQYNSAVSGNSQGIAASIHAYRRHGLYRSQEVLARCMSLAMRMLRESAQHSIDRSCAEIKAAWRIITSVISTDNETMLLHLPQLMLLWKNSFPRAAARASVGASTGEVHTPAEWFFLLEVRSSALEGLAALLMAPTKIDRESLRRVAAVLGEASAWLSTYSASLHRAHSTSHDTKTLHAAWHNFKLRLFTCLDTLARLDEHSLFTQNYYQKLSISSLNEVLDCSRAADGYPASSAVRSGQIGQHPTTWACGRAYGHAASALKEHGKGYDANSPIIGTMPVQTAQEYIIEALPRMPQSYGSDLHAIEEGDEHVFDLEGRSQVSSSLYDSAISLFSQSLVRSPESHQDDILQQIMTMLDEASGDQDAARRHARLASIVACMAQIVAASGKDAPTQARLFPSTSARIAAILSMALHHKDAALRQCAARSYGRLCALTADATLLANAGRSAIEHIVQHTDAYSRAGCAHFLGCAVEEAGAVGSKALLKTALGVVLSLVRDPHPLVHYWALRSLSQLARSSGFGIEPHIRVISVALVDSCSSLVHDPETASDALGQISESLPISQAICAAIESLVGTLGPALAEARTDLSALIALTLHLVSGSDSRAILQGSRVVQQLLLVCPQALHIGSVIQLARRQLTSSQTSDRAAAVDTAYYLVQKDASLMSRLGGDEFVRYLLAIYDDSTDTQGVWQTLRSWISQTSPDKLSGWVAAMQHVLHTGLNFAALQAPVVKAAKAEEDEEALGLGPTLSADSSRSSLRWQTQILCLRCLSEVLLRTQRLPVPKPAVVRGASLHQADVPMALAKRMPEMIKIAFGAISSRVTQVRLQGLATLDTIIQTFSEVSDDAYEGGPVLLQYQASLVSALAPSWDATAPAELATRAIAVSGHLLATGTFRQAGNFKRLTEVLETALDLCTGVTVDVNSLLATLPNPSSRYLACSTVAAWADVILESRRSTGLAAKVTQRGESLLPLFQQTLCEAARRCLAESQSVDASNAGITSHDAIELHQHQFNWSRILQAFLLMLMKAKLALSQQIVRQLSVLALQQASSAIVDHSGAGHDIRCIHSPVMCLIYLLTTVCGNESRAESAQLASDSCALAVRLHALRDSQVDQLVAALAAACATVQVGLESGTNSRHSDVLGSLALRLLLSVLSKAAANDNAQNYTRTWHLVNELAWRLPVDPRIDLHRMTLSITYAHCSMRSYEMRKAAETTVTAIMRVHQSKAVALDLLAIAEKFGEEESMHSSPEHRHAWTTSILQAAAAAGIALTPSTINHSLAVAADGTSLAGTAGLVAVIGKSYREAPLIVVGVLRILLPRLLAHLLDKPGQLSHTSTLDLVAKTSQSLEHLSPLNIAALLWVIQQAGDFPAQIASTCQGLALRLLATHANIVKQSIPLLGEAAQEEFQKQLQAVAQLGGTVATTKANASIALRSF